MEVKEFSKQLVEKHRRPRSHKDVGELSEKVGHEILETYEECDIVRKPTENFRGQPFDRLCRKQGHWYIVEIKGGRRRFGGTPGHTQKRRMRLVLDSRDLIVKGLEPGLLQIDLKAFKYRIRYGEEVRKLIEEHERKQQQIDNIIEWVKKTISASE